MSSIAGASLSGSTAFMLHDTYGFPLELTQEIAGERDVDVDLAGFQTEMTAQRERAKAARKDSAVDGERLDGYREVVEQFGTTEFVGDADDEAQSRVLAVLRAGTTTTTAGNSSRSSSTARRSTPSRVGRSETSARSPPTPAPPPCSTRRTHCRTCGATHR